MKNILEVKKLDIKINQLRLVKNVSFSIAKGEIFAIVGESGSGKSITSLSLLQLLQFQGSFDVSGEAVFEGRGDLIKMDESEIRDVRGKDVSIIFQDPMTSLNPLHSVGDQLREVMQLHRNISNKEADIEIKKMFKVVGLSDQEGRLNALPHEFSGGQRQRIMIVMAMLNDPSLLIADEPTTALDVTVQSEILSLFKKVRDDFNKSILLISHDLSVVRNIADKVAVMYNGEIVEQGSISEVFDNPQHPYTKKLLSSEPKGKAIFKVSNDNKEVLKVDDLNIKYITKKSILGLNNAFVQAVDSIKFNLLQGQSIGIVGESGSGKSSIAKALLKLIDSSGDFEFKGQNISSLKEKDFRNIRKDFQIVFQDPYSSLNPRMTVGDIVKEGFELHYPDENKASIIDKVNSMLEYMGFDSSYVNRYPHQLSGGQKQRISIARSMIMNPELVILDEPTSALDLITQADIIKLLQKFQKERNTSYIFISHDLRVVKSICDYILVVKNGMIVEQGESEDIFERPVDEYTKKLIKSAFFKNL